jgi:hypothetical protein
MFDNGSAGHVDYCEVAQNKFDTNGFYEVCVGIMTIDGCTDYFCDTIEITYNCPEPIPGYSYTTNELGINFAATSTSTVTTWLGYFGDGATSCL